MRGVVQPISEVTAFNSVQHKYVYHCTFTFIDMLYESVNLLFRYAFYI